MALGRAEQRSIVAKVRVYELAKEFGVESKAVMAELENMGEFVRSASSTIEAPVVRRLKEQFAGDSAKPGRQAQRATAPRGSAGIRAATGSVAIAIQARFPVTTSMAAPRARLSAR